MDTKALSVGNILTEGKSAGCLIGGMIAGNVIIKLDKKGGLIFPAGLAVGGILGATMLKNIYVKLLLLGVSTFGAIKLLNKISSPEVIETTQGLFGFKLPESITKMLNQYIPNLGEVTEVDYSRLLGDPLYLPELQPGVVPLYGSEQAVVGTSLAMKLAG